MMENYIIKFTDLTTKESYCELQRFFIGFDYEGKYLEQDELNRSQAQVMKLNEPLNNPEIIFYSRTENLEDLYTAKKFEEDFLIPKIEPMAILAFEAFKNNIKSKGLYTPELVDGYSKDFNNRLNISRNAIKEASYLKKYLKDKLEKQYNQLEELIQAYILNPFPQLKRKIQFNLIRTDVIYFFHLLRDNKIISDIRDVDLGRIIDNGFEYNTGIKGEYHEISDSVKHFNAFKNTEGRPEEPANKRLRAIFQNDDFYNS